MRGQWCNFCGYSESCAIVFSFSLSNSYTCDRTYLVGNDDAGERLAVVYLIFL